LAAAAVLLGAACNKGGGGGAGGGGGGVVGAWTIDTDSLVTAMTEMAKKQPGADPSQMPAEARAGMEQMMRDMVKAQAAKMNMTIEFKADGTASMTGTMSDENVSGTAKWHMNGNEVVLTERTKNGKPEPDSGDKEPKMLLKDGKLVMTAEGMPFEIAFKRK
jgi:hypothetical protein